MIWWKLLQLLSQPGNVFLFHQRFFIHTKNGLIIFLESCEEPYTKNHVHWSISLKIFFVISDEMLDQVWKEGLANVWKCLVVICNKAFYLHTFEWVYLVLYKRKSIYLYGHKVATIIYTSYFSCDIIEWSRSRKVIHDKYDSDEWY